MTDLQERRQATLDTHVLDLPISPQAKWAIIQELDPDVDFEEIERVTGATSGSRFLAGFRDVPGLRLSNVRDHWQWQLPRAGAARIQAFAMRGGLTRIDWPALPYREDPVAARLSRMSQEEILALPALVFGFLDTHSPLRWVFRMCGIDSRDVRNPYPDWGKSEATIGKLLTSTKKLEDDEAVSKAFTRFRKMLRRLGFNPARYPILYTDHELLIKQLVKEESLTKRRAAQVVNIAVRQGWIPKRFST